MMKYQLIDSNIVYANKLAMSRAKASLAAPLSTSMMPGNARRFSAWHIGLLIAVSAAGAGSVAQSRPDLRFQRALDDLKSSDAESVQYQITWLAHPNFEAHANLLRSWLRLQAMPIAAADLADVWDDLNEAIEGDANRALSLAVMGRALYQNGQLTDATWLMQQSLVENPEEAEAHRGLAVAWYELGVMPRALYHLERLAKYAPRDSGAHRLMGLIFSQQGDLDGAIAAYRESLARNGRQSIAAEIRLDLARCLYTRQKYDEALDVLGSAESSAAALALKAECCHALGKDDDARACIKGALAKAPDDADVLSVAAMLITDGNNSGEAVELLERAVEQAPKDYELNYRLMQAYRRGGNTRRAQEMSEQVKELLRLNDRLNELAQQANNNLDDADLRYEIAAIAEQLGMTESAETWRKAARMLEAASTGRPAN